MIAEYQNYTPENPALITSSNSAAQNRLGSLLETSDPASAGDEDFLNGWWALIWLHPGLHSDDFEVWPDELNSTFRGRMKPSAAYPLAKSLIPSVIAAEALHLRILAWECQIL